MSTVKPATSPLTRIIGLWPYVFLAISIVGLIYRLLR